MTALTPEALQDLLDRVDDLSREAKAVRRRASVVVTQGARLREQLQQLQTEEVTSTHAGDTHTE
jgi:hypothetical protein